MEANVLAEPEMNGQEDEQANQGKNGRQNHLK